MGLLEQLFGIYTPQIPQPPAMTSVLPFAAQKSLQNGILPTLNVSTLIMSQGEICHYVDKACLFTKKVERHYRRVNRGSSFRVMKGWTYHTGNGESHPVEIELPVYTPGYLYFTNKRVVFVSKEKGFEKKLSSLTAVTGYSDAIVLKFSSKTYSLLLHSAPSAQRTLALLKP